MGRRGGEEEERTRGGDWKRGEEEIRGGGVRGGGVRGGEKRGGEGLEKEGRKRVEVERR